MTRRPQSGCGRRPLAPIAESPEIRACRNASSSRTEAISSAEKGHVLPPITVPPPRRRSPRALTRNITDVESPKRGEKRPRSQDAPVSTPRKARRLLRQFHASSQSTPQSARYDSGIEMTPESGVKLCQNHIEARTPSPCDRKHRPELRGHPPACDADDHGSRQATQQKRPHQGVQLCPVQKSPSTSSNDEAQGRYDCVSRPPSPSEESGTRNSTGNACTRSAGPKSHGSAPCRSSSHHQYTTNITTANPQTIWQPGEAEQDIIVLLSILGETVVQQQRQRTILQRWLRSHDDHLMFWLNYGGSSSPSDYLRWTKNVVSHQDPEDKQNAKRQTSNG